MISQLSPETRYWVYSSQLNSFSFETTPHNNTRQLFQFITARISEVKLYHSLSPALALQEFVQVPYCYFPFLQKEKYRNYCNKVGIATSYGLDERGVGVRVPVRPTIFSSPLCPD
jgi:hypothetical protein